MIWRSYGRFFIYLTDKVDEPEKTTGPSGVIPIAVLKEESNVIVKKEYLKIIYRYKLY
jgi:hypothetical protein